MNHRKIYLQLGNIKFFIFDQNFQNSIEGQEFISKMLLGFERQSQAIDEVCFDWPFFFWFFVHYYSIIFQLVKLKLVCCQVLMASNSKKRQLTPNTYKLIHSKSANLLTKKVVNQLQKESEYFPGKVVKATIPNFLKNNNSLNSSSKDFSESSRYISKDTNLSESLKRQLKISQKQIQTLRRQLKHYQRKVIQKQDKGASIKKLESELVETYRVILYYEAKIDQLQKICVMYEQGLQLSDRKTKQQKISLILEQFRKENVQLRIELEKVIRTNTLMNKQVGDLSVIRVQLEQKIKNYQKKTYRDSLSSSQASKSKKIIDDYQREHLIGNNGAQIVKKRPMLSRKKRVKLASGQSQSEQSSIGVEYKNNIYTKRSFNRSASKKPGDDGLQGRMKSKMFGNISSKINNIQNQIQNLKKQNQKLQGQLDIKVNDSIHLKKINQQLQMKINLLEQTINNSKSKESMPQKIVISKSMIKEINKPQPQKSEGLKINQNSSENKLSMFVSNISMQKNNMSQSNSPQSVSQSKNNKITEKVKKTCYKFNEIKQKTLRKLLVHLTKSQVTFQQLLYMIAQYWSGNEPNSLIQQLESAPYNLSPQQTAEFMFQYKQIIKYISSKESEQAIKDMNEAEYRKYIQAQIKKVLEDNIPNFKNITFRRQFSLNIQLANKFKNYDSQFEQLIEKYTNRIPYKQCQQIFVKDWGLTEEQFMCLVVKNYEQNDQLQFLQLEQISRNYLSQ